MGKWGERRVRKELGGVGDRGSRARDAKFADVVVDLPSSSFVIEEKEYFPSTTIMRFWEKLELRALQRGRLPMLVFSRQDLAMLRFSDLVRLLRGGE
ncbi:MAG: hypothetical protein QXT77_05295 [Candidatus Methanomethylicaceae archaeon]